MTNTENDPDNSGDPAPRSHRIAIMYLVYALGWCWPYVMAMSGVSRDHYTIALGRKVCLTAISLVLPFLIFRFGGPMREGCAVVLCAFCALAIFVMWIWN